MQNSLHQGCTSPPLENYPALQRQSNCWQRLHLYPQDLRSAHLGCWAPSRFSPFDHCKTFSKQKICESEIDERRRGKELLCSFKKQLFYSTQGFLQGREASVHLGGFKSQEQQSRRCSKCNHVQYT